MFRRAFRAEGRAFVRLDLPLQNQAAKAFDRFGNVMVSQAEFLLRIERGIGFSQTKAALRNFANTAPFARHDLENLPNQFLRRSVAFAAHRADILIFDLGAAAGSTIAGNLFILGAASNIIIIQNAEKKTGDTITFLEFAKIGIPLTLLNVLVYYLSFLLV